MNHPCASGRAMEIGLQPTFSCGAGSTTSSASCPRLPWVSSAQTKAPHNMVIRLLKCILSACASQALSYHKAPGLLAPLSLPRPCGLVAHSNDVVPTAGKDAVSCLVKPSADTGVARSLKQVVFPSGSLWLQFTDSNVCTEHCPHLKRRGLSSLPNTRPGSISAVMAICSSAKFVNS